MSHTVHLPLKHELLRDEAANAANAGCSVEVARSHRITLHALAMAAETRDLDTACHMIRVGQVSGLLAQRLTANAGFADLMCRAAPMHDIGKIGIADAVLKKPGPLTVEEWVHMRTHAEIGGRLLYREGIDLFTVAAQIARHHHEKVDGSGYPDGLRGHDIPLSARVAAVADFYDALTHRRCYHAPRPHHEVLAMIEGLAGTHFDPDVVDVLLQSGDDVAALSAAVDARFDGRGLCELGETAFDPIFQ